MTLAAKIIMYGILGLLGVSVIPYFIAYSFRRGWDEGAEKKKLPEDTGMLICAECSRLMRGHAVVEDGLFVCPVCSEKDGEK